MCDLPEPIPFLRMRLRDTRLRWRWVARADRYFVEMNPNGSGWFELPQGTRHSYINFPNLSSDKLYAFRVRAKNACGYGEYSPVVYYSPRVTANIDDIEWIERHRSEPGLLENDPDAAYMKQSDVFEINVNQGVDKIFLNHTDVCGLLIVCKGDVTMSEGEGEVTFTIPKSSIIIGNSGTHVGKTTRKIFVEEGTGRRHVLDETGVQGFEVKGFKTDTNVINMQDLRKLGFVNEQGILSLKFVHIVNGTGHAYVYASIKRAQENPTPPPSSVAAEQIGSQIKISWEPVNATAIIYKRVKNGEWTIIAKLPAQDEEFYDLETSIGQTCCYKVGIKELPEAQDKACVFVKSI